MLVDLRPGARGDVPVAVLAFPLRTNLDKDGSTGTRTARFTQYLGCDSARLDVAPDDCTRACAAMRWRLTITSQISHMHSSQYTLWSVLGRWTCQFPWRSAVRRIDESVTGHIPGPTGSVYAIETVRAWHYFFFPWALQIAYIRRLLHPLGGGLVLTLKPD